MHDIAHSQPRCFLGAEYQIPVASLAVFAGLVSHQRCHVAVVCPSSLLCVLLVSARLLKNTVSATSRYSWVLSAREPLPGKT